VWPRFDETFRLDPDGLPRRWSKADNIEETFKEARQLVRFLLHFTSLVALLRLLELNMLMNEQQAYGVLDAYSIVRLRESDRRLSFFDNTLAPASTLTRDRALVALPFLIYVLYSVCVCDTGVDPSLVVISADQCNITRDTFKRESDPAFIEAKREQEREVSPIGPILNCARACQP
jgi:hypothetical protein